MTVTINGTEGVTLDNGSADGAQVSLASSGYSNWNLDNYSGRFRAYYGASEKFTIDTSGNVGISTGNLNFSGSAQRITGDFSNATVANRVMFQSSTTNGNTVIGVMPNGTAVTSTVDVYNAPVTGNDSRLTLLSTSNENSLRSSINGTGTYLPMTFYTGGSEQARIDTSGVFYMNSGYGSSAKAYGCRAWVNFNGTGTVAIGASGNVSSITDNGTGDYTVNFSTAMPDANYSYSGSATTYPGYWVTSVNLPPSTLPSASSLRLVVLEAQAGGTAFDPATVCVHIFR